MKIAISVSMAMAVLASTSFDASARSCEQIAAACFRIAVDGGYDKNEWKKKCYDPERMAGCKRTGKYNAPSGKVWQADK